MSETHLIDFGVSITKGNQTGVAQVIYQNIAYCADQAQRQDWLEIINDLNVKMGIYYYFCLGDDGYVYIRHVRDITTDVEGLFNTLIQGPMLIHKALPLLERRLGINKKGNE